MKGDFTRVTFKPEKNFSRVLSQQGRVSIDADSAEQTAILLHYLRTLAQDIIGPHGAPSGQQGGFELTLDNEGRPNIEAGRYYVDGIMVENAERCLYTAQADYPLPENDPLKLFLENPAQTEGVWLYLDVWERLITPIEDDSIREKALGGPDTCVRAKIVWQLKSISPEDIKLGMRTDMEEKISAAAKKKVVKATKSAIKKSTATVKQKASAAATQKASAAKLTSEKAPATEAAATEAEGNTELADYEQEGCLQLREFLNNQGRPLMAAQIDSREITRNPCTIAPEAKYRGAENQLYRIEIHRSGTADTATFSWSRENGSVATAWLASAGNSLTVANSRGFSAGNWVELSDDTLELQGESGVLVKLANVEGDTLVLDENSIASGQEEGVIWFQGMINPKIRRWDQTESGDIILSQGAVPVVAQESQQDGWINLEDGVQIRFAPDGYFHSADYWLIPARVATGNIEWPEDKALNQAAWLPPHGIEHHYAPLGFMAMVQGVLKLETNCRCEFNPIRACL